jgi:DNA-binding SARP family transcriptional activator/tetratricopeptide (TPR) repeat protein
MQFRILGPLAVTDDDGEEVRLPAGRARIVLAALCAEAGLAISRDRLIDIAWNGKPPATAPTQLHALVGALRRALGAAPGVIVTLPDGYLLRVGEDDVDLTRLRRLIALSRRSRANAALGEAADLLGEVLALWRGRPFAGLDCVELAAAADLNEQEYVNALEEYADAMLLLGQHAALTERLAGWVSAYPLREGLRESFVVALARSGRQTEAIATYHNLRHELAEELGVDPGPSLQQAYHEVLAGSAQAIEPPDVELAQLPAAIADFTGRTEEAAALRDAMTRPDGQPVALVISAVSGTGGVGKSALAVHVAHAMADAFPGGQLYVNLGGTSAAPADPAEVLASLLRDLGLRPVDVPADPGERGGRYRSLLARRRALVVLDDARDSAQVRPLLPGAGGCAVIVTSRARLTDLPCSRRIDLGAMADAEARQLLARIIGATRVAAEPEAADQILQACGGFPLAIRIVAAKLAARPGWSLLSVAGKLAAERSRLAELRYGDLAVRASFRLSYDLLAPPAARAFQLLGLTPAGPVSLAAAAALLGTTAAGAEEVLGPLADAHLVEAPAADRYRLHDLLRLFAADLAAASGSQQENDQGALRLVTWYAAALRAAAGVLAQGETLPRSADWELDAPTALVPEFGSFTDALHWCQAEQERLVWAVRTAAAAARHDLVVVLATLLSMYAVRIADMRDFLVTQQIGLDSARALEDLYAQAWLLGGLGDALIRAGQPEQAVTHFEQALAIRQHIGRTVAIGVARNSLATVYHDMGRCAAALAQFRLAQAIMAEAEQDRFLGVTLLNEAECHRESGNYHEALSRYGAAADVLKRADYPLGEAQLASGEGETLRRLGRPAAALERHQAALAGHRLVGTGHRALLTTLDQLALALADLGRLAEARAYWEEAADIAAVTGDPRAAEFRARPGG